MGDKEEGDIFEGVQSYETLQEEEGKEVKVKAGPTITSGDGGNPSNGSSSSSSSSSSGSNSSSSSSSSDTEHGGVKSESDEDKSEGDERGEEGKKKKQKRLPWVKKIESLYLEVWQSSKLIERIALGKDVRVLFGRDKKSNVVLNNPSTSRRHCALAVGVPPEVPAMDQAGITLLDLKTNNGTFWTSSYPCRPPNRQRVPKGGSVTLKNGYCFRCGESSQSYVVRGLDGNKHQNPNFMKVIDSEEVGRNNALSKDFGLAGPAKKRGHGAMVSSNPFKESYRDSDISQQIPTVLPTLVDDSFKRKLSSGGTTFSFHNKLKSEMDTIRYEHEHKMRKRVLEMMREEADCQTQLDMTTK
jgi:hypothetical protein